MALDPPAQRYRYRCRFCHQETTRDFPATEYVPAAVEEAHTYGPRVAPAGKKQSLHLQALYCSETRLYLDLERS